MLVAIDKNLLVAILSALVPTHQLPFAFFMMRNISSRLILLLEAITANSSANMLEGKDSRARVVAGVCIV
jgi:hypothetical protein